MFAAKGTHGALWSLCVLFGQVFLPVVMALSIVEASIADLQESLKSGQTNAVELTAKHLLRVARYDRRGPRLNSIPVLNPSVFEHAQASDDYRSQNNGSIRSPLEGIPATIKDSYMMEGLTVASGSPAFQNLTASADAFTVGEIRKGGGIIIGKTNMPPMANGGMQRGVYGRAESPYNEAYLAAAYASGSSNGAGASTGASLAVFAMGEETVSSGRSPASNNGLVAYTPSRGVLSIRGNWPLFPAADVVVPYARSVEDMLEILDVLVANDADTSSDFWRGQPFIKLPLAEDVRPTSYHGLADANALRGKRIGVPKMYIGEEDPAAQPVWTSPEVRELWDKARVTLEGLGATVEEVGFPLVTNFETAPSTVACETDYPIPSRNSSDPDLSTPANADVFAWDDYLKMVNDTSSVTNLAEANPRLIFPQLPNTLLDRYGNRFGQREPRYIQSVEEIKLRENRGVYELPGMETHIRALEARRVRDLEKWMDEHSFDALVWPAAGDVGPEDAETNDESAVLAWRNGVFFSNGNYVIRQFGVPTVGVNMGLMKQKRMPMALTFAGKAYDDNKLLSYAYAFETAHPESRVAAPRTPELDTDEIPRRCSKRSLQGSEPPKLIARASRVDENSVHISGTVDLSASGPLDKLEVFVDGVGVGPVNIRNGQWSVVAQTQPYDDLLGDVPVRFVNDPDQSLAMIVVLASAHNRRSDAKLIFV
ncbi:amidase signature enzyme [Paramyrothecium foliicola]|nr:amidase signature enzyme [Paramyrothecium foliicola]